MGETTDRRARHRAPHKTSTAREMRGAPSDAERSLWGVLRGRRFCGVRFRRQQPIGPYIVDFYCSAAKLVIELDRSQHGEESRITYDQNRTRYLGAEGFRVLRFWNQRLLRRSRGRRASDRASASRARTALDAVDSAHPPLSRSQSPLRESQTPAITACSTLPLREGQNREAILGWGHVSAHPSIRPTPKNLFALLRDFSTLLQGEGRLISPAMTKCWFCFRGETWT